MKLQIESIKSSDFYSTHNHCHNSETFGCQKAFAGFVFAVVGIDSRVKHMLAKHHAYELHLNPTIQLENTFITTTKHYTTQPQPPHSLLCIALSHTASNESVDLPIHDVSYKQHHKHLCMASLLPNITHYMYSPCFFIHSFC